MELVPILSAIILAFTIATFILAIAAYVNYKLRERSRKKKKAAGGGNLVAAPAPAPPPHVLVEATATAAPALPAAQEAPAFLPPAQKSTAFLPPPTAPEFTFTPHEEPQAVPVRPVSESFFETAPSYMPDPQPEAETPSSMFWEYTEEGFVPMAPDGRRGTPQSDPFGAPEPKSSGSKPRPGQDTLDDNAWL